MQPTSSWVAWLPASPSCPKEILASRPAELIRRSVRGMLPKTRLGDKLINNLYVYAGAEHPHQAQNPKTITLNEI